MPANKSMKVTAGCFFGFLMRAIFTPFLDFISRCIQSCRNSGGATSNLGLYNFGMEMIAAGYVSGVISIACCKRDGFFLVLNDK
jgi:hypothetical protein